MSLMNDISPVVNQESRVRIKTQRTEKRSHRVKKMRMILKRLKKLDQKKK